MKTESKSNRLKRFLNKLALPVLILPALAVTLASLFALVTTVLHVAAESQPSDLLFPLRQPALQLQAMLTTDPGERTEIEIRLQAALPATPASHPLIQPTQALAQDHVETIAGDGPLPSSTSSESAASSGSIASPPSNTPAPTNTAESRPTEPPTLSHTSTPIYEVASPTIQPSNTFQPTATENPPSPTPTFTPSPSNTPQPTATKQAASPTFTASLPSSNTPQPTATKQAASPTSTATSTSLPSNTATFQPTATYTQVFLPTSTPQPDEVRIEGNVEAIGGNWVVSGQSFIVNGDTEIRDNPQLGDRVEVRAWRYWDGSLAATRIRPK